MSETPVPYGAEASRVRSPSIRLDYVSASTRGTNSFSEIVEAMKAAHVLGIGYEVIHDLRNNPSLDSFAMPTWTMHIFHYHVGEERPSTTTEDTDA